MLRLVGWAKDEHECSSLSSHAEIRGHGFHPVPEGRVSVLSHYTQFYFIPSVSEYISQGPVGQKAGHQILQQKKAIWGIGIRELKGNKGSVR